jgi:transcriptional regulator with XRE-family HTH domain
MLPVRLQRALTQAELAEKLELSKSFISELEAGNRKPSIDVLEKYAGFFRMPLSSLVLFSEQLDPRIITGVCLAVEGHRVPNKLHLKIAKDFQSLASEGEPSLRKKTSLSLLGRLEAAGLIDPKYKARAATLRASMRGC